jgi:hypothetical protein
VTLGPPPHALPPPDLHRRPLPITLMAGPWTRIHSQPPLYFGKGGAHRFDDPEQKYGVLYAGVDLSGALPEVFGNRVRYGAISIKELQTAQVSQIVAARAARFVDITGAGLLALSADARLAAGDYDVAQPWSRGFHEHPDAPDGILYRARTNPGCLSVAFFERFGSALSCPSPPTPLLLHEDLAAVLDQYKLGIVGAVPRR